jgi:DNA repair exonuclease SbcCD ATPase subunit
MIKINKIRFRNLLSYGNAWTEYVVKGGQIVRISGVNGLGKSAIVDALYFAFFGKPYRKIKLGQLINAINKKRCEVELYFTRGEHEFKIFRSLTPNKLEIYKDDDLVPVSSHTRSYQTILEEDILHMNENIFNQTVVKSMTKNISFLTLSKYEKRKIVETILSIEIFSIMNNIAREELNDFNDKATLLKKDIMSVERLIEQELSNLEQLRMIKEKIEKQQKQRTKQIVTRIEELKVVELKIEEGYERLKKYGIKLGKMRKDLVTCKRGIGELKKIVDRAKVSLKLSENKMDMFESTCKGCDRLGDICENENLDQKRSAVEDAEDNVVSEKKRRDKMSAEIDKLADIMLNKKLLDVQKSKTNRELGTLKGELEDFKDPTETIGIEEGKLEEYKVEKTNKQNEFDKINRLKDHYEIVRDLLNDDGIKTFIIQKYLPYINKLLNAYLQKFDADIMFNFDTEFREVIGSRYKEAYTYNSFSEGQKRRIDLAILFTFSDFSQIKNRNSEINVLILDEISAGLDAVGENALFDILRDKAEKEGKEIITISHSMGIDSDKIDCNYEVTMEGGFSKMALVENG